MRMQFTEFLTVPVVETIHQASLEILENVGILARSEKARDIYGRHGCRSARSSHARHASHLAGKGKTRCPYQSPQQSQFNLVL